MQFYSTGKTLCARTGHVENLTRIEHLLWGIVERCFRLITGLVGDFVVLLFDGHMRMKERIRLC